MTEQQKKHIAHWVQKFKGLLIDLGVRLKVLATRKPKTTLFWCLLIAGWWHVDWDGRKNHRWKEEVQLSTGEVIWVKRTAQLVKQGDAFGGPRGFTWTRGMTVEVIGDTSFEKPPLWSDDFYPLVFDIDPDNGEWVVIATFNSGDKSSRLENPRLPYLEYRLENGKWISGGVSTKFIDAKTPANLLGWINYREGESNMNLAEKYVAISVRNDSAWRCVTERWRSSDHWGCVNEDAAENNH